MKCPDLDRGALSTDHDPKIFPWDNDLDVQISEPTIHFLSEYYNMTKHHFDIPGVKGGRSYLLEINPYYVVKSTKDKLNAIDGRWIDMSSGLFIDITAVRKDDEKRAKGEPGALMCKDKHHYDESQIFPLRESYFEGVPVKIPYAYTELLEEEYDANSLTRTLFKGCIHVYPLIFLKSFADLTAGTVSTKTRGSGRRPNGRLNVSSDEAGAAVTSLLGHPVARRISIYSSHPECADIGVFIPRVNSLYTWYYDSRLDIL